jgi:Ca-activated chloride channel family protein
MKPERIESNEGPRSERERMRQLLCAALLGEVSESERAEVARALEADQVLRREQSELEATIGLVRHMLAGSETLSPQARERLAERSAGTGSGPERGTLAPRPVSWWRSGGFRAAAGLAVVAGAAYLIVQDGEGPSRTEVASAPASEADAKEVEPSEGPGRDKFGERRGKEDVGAELALGLPAEVARTPAPTGPEPQAKPDSERDDSALVATAEQVRLALEREQPRQDPAEGVLVAKLEQPHGQAPSGGNPLELVDRLNESQVKDQAILGYAGTALRGEIPAAGSPPESRSFPAVSEGELAALKEKSDSAGYKGPGSTVPPVNSPSTPAVTAGSALDGRGVGVSPPSRGGGAAQLAAGELKRRAGDEAGNARQRDEDAEAVLGWFEDADGAVAAGSDDFFLGKGRDSRSQGRLSAEECERQTQLLIDGCRARPGERPRDMFFRWWGDNAFEWTSQDSLSTFSVDVDTASYGLARKYLQDGYLPEKAQVRTEEFVNAFAADVPAPTDATFAVAAELAPSLFSRDDQPRSMLRVVLRGKEIPREARTALRLIFVVDVSGSMREGGRLELVKHALRLLAAQLDARDEVAIVTFTNEARLVLPMTSGADRSRIESAIHPLTPQQGTNVQAGLLLGFEHLSQHLEPGASNRIVLLSDGVANVGNTDAERLTAETERFRKQGIYLSTVGVGMNNHNDHLLEQLADRGDGTCSYVDDEREAREALVDRFTGAFEVIARDAKIQVEFDPAQVEQYRLLGYENRAVADRDFRNDAVDAGEVHSGHQVVALYELVRRPGAESERPLASVRVRWKDPYLGGLRDSESDFARELSWSVFSGAGRNSFHAASRGYRTSVLVAQFAEFLRRSVHARGVSFDQFVAEVEQLEREVRSDEVAEFAGLVRRSTQLVRAELGRHTALHRCYDDLRQHAWLCAQIDDLRLEVAQERRRELERERMRLEQELRDLMRKRCEGG